VGITLPQAGQQATRENVVRIAQNAEKEGFDSLWVFERLLWPINPQTPYPGTPDGSLPIESQNVFDPLETLTYVAQSDHVGNNDLIHKAEAKETHHFISEVGLPLLDPVTYFSDQFYRISTYGNSQESS